MKRGVYRQPSAFVEIYEQQLVAYLRSFTIPESYQEKILEAYRALASFLGDIEVACEQTTQ